MSRDMTALGFEHEERGISLHGMVGVTWRLIGSRHFRAQALLDVAGGQVQGEVEGVGDVSALRTWAGSSCSASDRPFPRACVTIGLGPINATVFVSC